VCACHWQPATLRRQPILFGLKYEGYRASFYNVLHSPKRVDWIDEVSVRKITNTASLRYKAMVQKGQPATPILVEISIHSLHYFVQFFIPTPVSWLIY
jgi:hypothetical protein